MPKAAAQKAAGEKAAAEQAAGGMAVAEMVAAENVAADKAATVKAAAVASKDRQVEMQAKTRSSSDSLDRALSALISNFPCAGNLHVQAKAGQLRVQAL